MDREVWWYEHNTSIVFVTAKFEWKDRKMYLLDNPWKLSHHRKYLD
jgi:hypothetical protein